MACETFKETINGRDYSVTQMPPSMAGPIKFQIAGMFGEGIKELMGVIGKKEDEQAAILFKVISKVVKENGHDEVFAFVKKIVCTVNYKGADDKMSRMDSTSFESLYAGDDLLEAYKVFLWVIKCNFSGFLKGLKLDQTTSQPTQTADSK